MNEIDNPQSMWLSPLVLDQGFSIEFRGDHIHIELGKDLKVSSESRISIWSQISQLCEEHDTRRLLIEGKLPEGVFQTTEVVDAGMKAATVPKLWLAFCFPDHIPNEQSELFEVIAASRGVRVKYFADRERALQWLRANSPS